MTSTLGASSWYWTPRLGSLMWGSELSLLWENLRDIIILQFVGCPPRGYEVWLFCKCAPLPSHCGLFFVFGCRISFLVGSSLFFLESILFIYFYFWLRWVFAAACGLSLVVASRGYSLLRCTGFSLRWLLLLQRTREGAQALVVVVRGL